MRHVARDCMVSFETNRYSVPFKFAGKEVEIQAEKDFILIYHKDDLVVSHPRCTGAYQNRVERAHYNGIFRKQGSPSAVSRFRQDIIPDEVQIRDLSYYERLVEGGAL